jgi:hypothetical protein
MSTPILTFDGNVVVAGGIPDQTINTTASALEMPGRGYSGYGEAVNQNSIWIMTNFAGNVQPLPAFKGQLWYDTSTRQLKLYDPDIYGSTWEPLAPFASPTNTDPIDPPLPGYSLIDGLRLTDTHGGLHNALRVTVGGEFVGVYSGDNEYQANIALTNIAAPGITNVYPGFNMLGVTNSAVTASEGLFDRVRLSGDIVVNPPQSGDIEFNGSAFQFSFPNPNGVVERYTPIFSEQLTTENVIYVGTNGSDVDENGVITAGSENSPFRSIGGALAYIQLQNTGLPTTIYVSAGTFVELNPLYVPPNVSIIATDPKNTFVQPLMPMIDVFHLDSGSYAYGITVINHSTPAAAFSFPTSLANVQVSNGNITIPASPSSGPGGYLFSYTGYSNSPGIFTNIFVEQNSNETGNAYITGSLVNGAITEILVTNPGSGYLINSPPPVEITGPGSGAYAIAIVSTAGTISYVQILDPGSGYGSDISQVSVSIGGPPSGVNATAIIPYGPYNSGGTLYAGNTISYINGIETSGSILCTKKGLNDGVLRSFSTSYVGGNYNLPPVVSIDTPMKLNGGLNITSQPIIDSCAAITGPFDINGVLIPAPGVSGLYGTGPNLPYNLPQTGNGYGNVNVNGAGTGVRVDAAVLNTSTRLSSIGVNNFRAITQGGKGISAINKGIAKLNGVSTSLASIGLSARSGGVIVSTGVNIEAGNIGLQATGYYPAPYATGAISATITNSPIVTITTSGVPLLGTALKLNNTNQVYIITAISGGGGSYALNVQPAITSVGAGVTVGLYNSSYIISNAALNRVGAGVTYNSLPIYGSQQIPSNELVGGGTFANGLNDVGRLYVSTIDNTGILNFSNGILQVQQNNSTVSVDGTIFTNGSYVTGTSTVVGDLFVNGANNSLFVGSYGIAGAGYAAISSGSASGNSGSLSFLDNNENQLALLYSSFAGGPLYIKNTQTNSPTVFYTGGSESMRITSAGLVGIGTSSPSATLHINGSVTAGIVTIATNGNLTTPTNVNCGGIIANNGEIATEFGIGTFLTVQEFILCEGTVTGTDFIASSDERLKSNIKTIENSLDIVTKMRGTTFNRKDSDKVHVGVIAQEIQKVMPELVHEDKNGYLGVSYSNMVALLIEAIKEQQTQIDELKSLIGK